MILSVSDQEEFRRADIFFCLLKIGSHVRRGGGEDVGLRGWIKGSERCGGGQWLEKRAVDVQHGTGQRVGLKLAQRVFPV
jgi:hypothetical protein